MENVWVKIQLVENIKLKTFLPEIVELFILKQREKNIIEKKKTFLKFKFFTKNFFCSINFPDNELYAGTVADFSGNDPIIYREPLQTEQYDSLSLNGE